MNKLNGQTSPYLLQHAENPVDWYPWGEKAFERAKREDKPIFLSIGYSTCHWCHVMAEESFEDPETAKLLNRSFICIKVDKEERPDIDSVYMRICQTCTGSGGWPMSIFMDWEQTPFFAGTYFPNAAFKKLLRYLSDSWQRDRASLSRTSGQIMALVKTERSCGAHSAEELIRKARKQLGSSFDPEYGGFGEPPKFPIPHDLIFLIRLYLLEGDEQALFMAEKTLSCLFHGGIFDHIGYSFSRYSTDRLFLVPHFEKMLYDNALLILAYAEAYDATGNAFYKAAAEKTAAFILTEMTAADGGFYSAQDADSEGVEGRFYLFKKDEVISLLGGKDGRAACEYLGITEKGNFEKASIPNLLHRPQPPENWEELRGRLYAYRKKRFALHVDDKQLTAWNGLMIAALARLYASTGNARYLNAAKNALSFFESQLCETDRLFTSVRKGAVSGNGFLDDYAAYLFALLCLHEITLEEALVKRASSLCKAAIREFWDEDGGFYLYGREDEQLILRPKETYDGAIPSGNSLMAYCLQRLSHLTGDKGFFDISRRQTAFMSAQAGAYPSGYCFFLMALLLETAPQKSIVCVTPDGSIPAVPRQPFYVSVRVTPPSAEYPLKEGKTTYYVCSNGACLAPTNDEKEAFL